MASLNTQPGSSSKAQRSVLVIEAKRRGIDLDELRRMVGGSVSALSAAKASEWIRQISGRPLPNRPGQAPRTTARAREGIVRMVTPELVDQIERIGVSYFDGSEDAYRAWLRKYHGVDHPRMLATARKAAQIATALKQMHTRRARMHTEVLARETST